MRGEPRSALTRPRHPLDHPEPPTAATSPPQPAAGDAGPVEAEVEFTFRGPASLRRRLRIAAATSGRSMKDLYVDALGDYLDRHGL